MNEDNCLSPAEYAEYLERVVNEQGRTIVDLHNENKELRNQIVLLGIAFFLVCVYMVVMLL